MLEPLKMNVNINDIYQYKLKSFFNSRALSINEEKFIFIDSGKNKEKVLSLHIKIMIFFFYLSGVIYLILKKYITCYLVELSLIIFTFFLS